MKGILVVVAGLGVLLAMLGCVTSCNEAVCASRVSKCMLIKCCECNMSSKRNCSCCTDCSVCLSDLFTECCSCVGLCPKPDPNMNLGKTSSIEDLNDPIPELFDVLTEMEDEEKRWMTFTYPRHIDTLYFKPGNLNVDLRYAIAIGEEGKKKPIHVDTDDSPDKNCSVAFFSQCMSIIKCKASCMSMGAAKYRWFHDYGCCQCIGNTCLDYGISQPKCLKCPPPNELEQAELEITDYDYSENSVRVDGKDEIQVADAGIDSVG